MKDFPDFMKNKKHRVPSSTQNTEDIDGYYYEGPGGGQMAFWTCYSDRESKNTSMISMSILSLYPADTPLTLKIRKSF